jgi:hypothetical protein
MGPDGSYIEGKSYNHKDHDTTTRKYKSEDPFVDIDCTFFPVLLNGNMKFIFFDHDAFGSDEKMFHFWINTCFIEGNYLCLEKAQLDKACKDKKSKNFPQGFKIELFLNRLEGASDCVFVADEEMDSDDADDDGDD